MDFQEVKSFLESDAGKSEDVVSYLQGLNPVTVDKIKTFVDKDKDVKSWFDSERDKHLSKGLETFKTNSLPKLLEEEIKKRYPQKDEKELALEALKAEVEKMKSEKLRESLINSALKEFTDKKLPVSMVDFLITDNEETTKTNLTKFEELFSAEIKKILAEKGLEDNYVPPKNNDTKTNKTSGNDVFDIINKTKSRK